MPAVDPVGLSRLWRQPPTSTVLNEWLDGLSDPSSQPIKADVKTYPDEVYHNYYSLSISLTFTPSSKGSGDMGLDRIDIYNPSTLPPPPQARRPRGPTYFAPALPITFHFPSDTLTVPSDKPGQSSREIPRPSHLEVGRETTGQGFVQCFGEPSKKSQGKIIGDLGMGLWMEWDNVEPLATSPEGALGTVTIGVLVELRDPGANQKLTPEQEKRGAGGVWDRAGSWEWSCLKLFDPEASQRP